MAKWWESSLAALAFGVIFWAGAIVVGLLTHWAQWVSAIILFVIGLLLLWRAYKVHNKKHNESEVKKIPEDFPLSSLFFYAHKCSNCGWGFRVSLYSGLATCPKCGNVDRHEL